MTDAEATHDSILEGLQWFRRQLTQHDVGMVFLSGHGVNDDEGRYNYLPANADPDRLNITGVRLQDLQDAVGATGKIVVFLDTCHAGNVLGKGRRAAFNDVNGVINELSATENGAVVFSSSTSRQFSLEDPAWGNGAFTKALVEGLGGAADIKRSGKVTHKLLDVYMSDRVKELTNGRQSPVTQAPGGVPDFPIAITN